MRARGLFSYRNSGWDYGRTASMADRIDCCETTARRRGGKRSAEWAEGDVLVHATGILLVWYGGNESAGTGTGAKIVLLPARRQTYDR
eukprot:CAMPEP_0178500212 /NCGR_PEP_ID=MMETSP0696-20121128/16257_1 /TAXON_ID=265572 /ORGANISM="Extubocellulus spinifer, Strain CCMP396" /LENGTH=87 /DNA_ID=CAMNT_0020129001 /DNA_START=878 /DNA_END=1137 /DNA_ORIENTATION=+